MEFIGYVQDCIALQSCSDSNHSAIKLLKLVERRVFFEGRAEVMSRGEILRMAAPGGNRMCGVKTSHNAGHPSKHFGNKPDLRRCSRSVELRMLPNVIVLL